VSKIGGRDRRHNSAVASLGKYYSSAANSDSVPVAKSICNIDIVTWRFCPTSIPGGDVRLSNGESDAE
jgi:hypothetical protein